MNLFQRVPFTAFEKICKYLDKQSFLQLREVCKSVNESFASLGVSQTIQIDPFIVATFSFGIDTTKISVSIESENESFMWKLCFISIIRSLGVLRDVLGYQHCVLTLGTKDAGNVLKSLKSLIRSAKTNQIVFTKYWAEQHELLRILADVLGENNLKYMFVGSDIQKGNFHDSWLEFIASVRPEDAFLSFKLIDKVTAKFLVRISQYIKMIQLNGIETTTISVLPIIKGMLSGKCERLYFVGRTKPLEGEEVEQLIRFTAHQNKKLFLCVTFKLSEFSTQIGMDKIFARYNQLYMNV